MRTVLQLFFRAEGINPWMVLGCLVAAGLFESVGLVSLVPLLSLAADGGAEGSVAEASPVTLAVRDALAHVGLPLEFPVLLAFVVVALELRAGLQFLAMRHVGNAVAEFSTNLRTRLLQALFGARWTFLVDQPVGRFANAITDEAARSSSAYQLAASFLAQSVQTAAYLTAAAVISGPLALSALALGGVMGLLLHSLVRMARRAGQRQTRRMHELVIFLVDALRNIKPIRAMAKQQAFSNLLEDKIASLRKALRRQVLSKEGLRAGQDALLVLFLGVGALLALEVWSVPWTELLVVGIVLQRTVRGLAKIQRAFQDAAVVESPYQSINRLITAATAAPEPNSGQRDASFEQGCRIEQVDFSHGETQVLRSVSLEIPARQVTVLTGPSGAGKTTIADMILGLYRPDRGRVLLDGVSLDEIDLVSWRHLVGYVPQDLVLFHDTVAANLTVGDPDVDQARLRRALELAHAEGFVDALPQGLDTVVGEHGARLSGGQRQRIALARALVAEPKLLILDEVTSALDPQTELDICENIRELVHYTTVLAITHRPAFLDIADAVYRVEGGGVEEMKPLPESSAEDQTGGK